MGFYEKYCLPRFLNFACGIGAIQRQREKIVPHASGRVLESGMGSGLNIPYYNSDAVDVVWGLEPSQSMRDRAGTSLQKSAVNVIWLDSSSEDIPLQDHVADTVLLTYTLCTIPDWHKALLDMRRVLKPDGRLLFCEHGNAPDEKVRRWQRRINPVWEKIAGGCQLNRPIPEYIEKGGFSIQTLEADYIRGPRIAAFNYWGTAMPE